MHRALQLAQLGEGSTSPNPMVGCVIVHQDQIIGEGWHRKAGEPHAEVMAIRSVRETQLLREATLYVNLEPCSHHGRTPPCSDLILQMEIPQVVIANKDPNPLVAGRGIARLREHGVQVESGVMQAEGERLNRRFFTFHRQHRPYVILKWAESADGLMDIDRRSGQKGSVPISGPASRFISHQWRSQEDAILVGRTTAETDNPSLDVRFWKGSSPTRLVIDPQRKLPEHLKMFQLPGDYFRLSLESSSADLSLGTNELVLPSLSVDSILKALYEKHLLSVIVEGGRHTLLSFIEAGLWDEYRVFRSTNALGNGLPSPRLPAEVAEHRSVEGDQLLIGFQK